MKMARFFNKKVVKPIKRQMVLSYRVKEIETIENSSPTNENNEEKTIDAMDTQEKIAIANEILGQTAQNADKVKKIRKDKGLIERTESSKIVLTEDNRELLKD